MNGQAQFNFEKDQRDEYFNSLRGELSLWTSFDVLRRYAEFNLHGRVESDQAFDAVDAATGVTFAIITDDPLFNNLSTLFVRKAQVPPLLQRSHFWPSHHGPSGSDTGRRSA